jgi:hypothetical protein
VSAAEEFAQYQLHFIDYIQHDYKVIRPIVLFAETIAERSRQTGLERTTIGDKARRFVQEGMLGLVEQRAGQAGRKGHRYPEAVAAYLLYVKQLYPPIHDRELVRIVQRKFGSKTNHHTVKAFLARHASPVQLPVFSAMKEDSHWGAKCSKVHSYKGYILSQRATERKAPLTERRAPCTSIRR